MLHRYSRVFAYLVLFTFCFSSTVLPFREIKRLPNVKLVKKGTSVLVENGLKTAIFDTKEGNLRVNFADDIALGDKISATVYTIPSGKNAAKRQKNAEKLSKYKVEIEKQRYSIANKIINLTIPSKLKNYTFNLIVRNAKGKNVGNVDIPVAYEAIEPYDDFYVPSLGQAGNFLSIRGDFDGNLLNTNVQIGNKVANPIAESPRKTILQSPANVIGQTKINLKEENVEVIQDFRNLGVNLSATKLKLLKGETSELTIRVEGLEGIEDEVPLNLNCTGAVNMQGGNVQNIQIAPNQVQEGGVFIQKRKLKSYKTGDFNVVAAVLNENSKKIVPKQIVHVETEPKNIGDEENPVWWLKVKTLDGQIVDIYIKRDSKPNLKFCDWIQINEIKKDEINDEVITSYQKTEDPNKPCELTDKLIQITGTPIKWTDGRWRVKVKLPNGKTGYIYIRSPNKPDFSKYKWIRIWECGKISNGNFEIKSYTPTVDPTFNAGKPVLTDVPPKPTPTPITPATPTVKPCENGKTRNSRTIKRTFEVLDRESTISMNLSTDKGKNNDAANMAGWLRGIATLGGYIDVPEGARGGAAVADAALKYLEVGADILSALGKSGLGNKKVFEVKVSIFITTKKITVSCTSEEVCIDGAWVGKRKLGADLVEESNIRREIRIDETLGNDWGQIVDTSTRTFNPTKFEAYAKKLLQKEINKLRKNAENLDNFKKNCR